MLTFGYCGERTTFALLLHLTDLTKESHLVKATPLHRPPFVAAYGVMMSRDDGERSSV